MINIEFIAQFLVLAYAHQYPQALTHWSDNVRIFDACAEVGLIAIATAEQLKSAYVAIRDRAHRCTLSGQSRIIPDNELMSERQFVQAMWQQLVLSKRN